MQEKINQALSVIDSTPEDAAVNIERSKILDIDPDSYKDMKPQFDKEFEQFDRVPAQVGAKTSAFATKTEQHANLVKDDLSIMDKIEKRWDWYNLKVDEIPTWNRRVAEISNKLITDGKVTPEEQEELADLNAAIAEAEATKPKSVGTGESLVVEGVSALGDMARSYIENLDILGSGIGAGAVVGAGVGTVIFPGLGTLQGAKSGALKAIGPTLTFINALDAYKQVRGLTYNSLSNLTDDKGQPLNLDHDKKANISIGVGALSGVAGAVAGKVLTSVNPLLKRFSNPQLLNRALQKSPELLAKLQTFGGISKAMMAEGGEEGFQEFIQIVGEQFARIDDTEESFNNTLDNVIEAGKKSMNLETLKQVTQSAIVGAGVAGTIQVGSRIISRQSALDQVKQEQEVARKRVELMEKSQTLKEIGADLKETKLDQLSPSESSEFMKSIFGDGSSWMTISDLNQFLETNPDMSERINQLGVFEKGLNSLGDELNFPVEIPLADAMQIVKEVPDFADSLRFDPEGESTIEARNNTEEFVRRSEEVAKKQEEILSAFGDDDEITQEAAEQLDALRQKAKDPRPSQDEFDYIDSVSFVEVEGILSKEQAEEFNLAHLNAKRAIADSLREDVDNTFERHTNRIFKDVNGKDIQVTMKQLEKNFQVLDRFSTVDKSEAAMSVTKNHAKKGFSPDAIDPDTLPEDLREIFLNNKEKAKVLKRRKAFVKGGITVEEAAARNGFESSEEFLNVLATTPSKSQVNKQRVQRKIELRNRIEQDIKPAKLLARDKAFSDQTKIYLREMKFMRENEWTTTKRGIIKIGKKVPTVKELTSQAQAMVRSLKINEVKPNTFLVGERQSQNNALKDFVDGKFERAFENKKKAALNNELRKEAIKAADQIEKNKDFWKKVLRNGSVKQELKDAGYADVMNDFTAAFRLDGSNKNINEQNRFTEFVKRQAQLGVWMPEIPKRLTDHRGSINDMTVAQYQEITDFGRVIVAQAKVKNKLQKKADQRAELATMDRLADQIQEVAQQHYNYDLNKNKQVETRNLSFGEGIKNNLATATSYVSNIKTIALELDQEQFGGFFQKTLVEPIKVAINNKRFEVKQITEADHKIVKEFYKGDEFERMMNTFIEVPEFKGISQLGLQDGKGTIKKSDLLVMFAYAGDPNARESFANFEDPTTGRRLTFEEIQAVLDRELSETDALFAHNFLVKRWERFADRSKDLHERTTGTEVQFVEGVSFTHRGKTFEGGYYPIERNRLTADAEAQKAYDSLVKSEKDSVEFGKDLTSEDDMFAQMRSAEMTYQGRLKERTGSQRTLNLNFDNVFKFTEQMVHDLHLREPSAEALKILKDKRNVANITAIVGQRKYGVLLNSMKDIASKVSERNRGIFAEQSAWIEGVVNKVHQLHAIQVIAYSVKSMGMQALSLGNVVMRHGPKSAVYIASQAKSILSNPGQYSQYVELANKINPDIGFEQDGIDDAITKHSNDWMPASQKFFSKYKSESAQGLNRLKKVQEKWIGEYGFAGLRELDKANRVVVTLAIAEQFLNGDIDGYPLKRVESMTKAEQAETLRILTQQTSDTSLTANSIADKTPIEKNKAISQFVRYFVDRRAGLNTVLSQKRKVQKHLKNNDYKSALGVTMTTVITMGAMKAWVGIIRDEEESIVNQLKDAQDAEDYIGVLGDTVRSTVAAPFTETAGYIPFVDSVAYIAGLDSDKKLKATTPFTSVVSEIANGWKATNDIISNILEDGFDGAYDNLSASRKKSLLHSMGYMVGGAPTNALYRTYEAIDETLSETQVIAAVAQSLNKNIDAFAEKFKGNEDAQAFIDDLKELKKTLPQTEESVKTFIPENSQDDMKQILSGGDWKALNEETGATGVYQFTEQRWEEVRALAPELGLTENGRVSRNSEQQEKAMKWSIENATEEFVAYGIDVNTENLLGAHIFGSEAFIAIHDSPKNKKLSDLLGDLAEQPEFKNFKTVGAIKQYLKKQVDKVENEQ